MSVEHSRPHRVVSDPRHNVGDLLRPSRRVDLKVAGKPTRTPKIVIPRFPDSDKGSLVSYRDEIRRRRVLTERLKVDWERYDRQQQQYIARQLLRARSSDIEYFGQDDDERIIRLVRRKPRE